MADEEETCLNELMCNVNMAEANDLRETFLEASEGKSNGLIMAAIAMVVADMLGEEIEHMTASIMTIATLAHEFSAQNIKKRVLHKEIELN